MPKNPSWKLHPESAMMRQGYNSDLSENSVVAPKFNSTIFKFANAQDGEDKFKNPVDESTLIYIRLNHPNARFFEEGLAFWEGAESCAAFNSGMAAIFTVCFEFLKPGDFVLASEPLYGGSTHLLNDILTEKMGIRVVEFNNSNFKEKLDYLRSLGQLPTMIFIETPANPTISLIDIEMCRELTIISQPLIVVDNTLLGPLYQYPLKHGADLSVYSATKYIGGLSNGMAGACVGSKELITRLKTMRVYLGNILGPDTSVKMLEGLQTLNVRMPKQMDSACQVAEFLNRHPKVEKVHHLSLLKETDPEYAIYKKQCLAAGGLVSIEIKGGKEEAQRFLNSLTVFGLAVSLGSVESLAEHPYTMTHAGVSPEMKSRMGITENMVRLSIGTEHVGDDLIRDLKEALATI